MMRRALLAAEITHKQKQVPIRDLFLLHHYPWLHGTLGGERPRIRDTTAAIRNSTIATKKMIFAISIAVPAIPPKPNTAAISAMIRNVTAQLIMIVSCKTLHQTAQIAHR